jgi:hypothetical protein
MDASRRLAIGTVNAERSGGVHLIASISSHLSRISILGERF